MPSRAMTIDLSYSMELSYWPYVQWGIFADACARRFWQAATPTHISCLIEPLYQSHSSDSYLIGAQHGTEIAQCSAAAGLLG